MYFVVLVYLECTRNVLAQVQVLALEVPLSKIVEEAESQEYMDAVEKVEPLYASLYDRILYSFLNEDSLFFVDVFFAWMSSPCLFFK